MDLPDAPFSNALLTVNILIPWENVSTSGMHKRFPNAVHAILEIER